MGIVSPNRHLLAAVATKLEPILDKVVFVGGHVVELLLTDPAAIRVRATTDVDVVVAGTRLEYHRMEERIRELGFHHDVADAPICRWRTNEGYVLDLMPVNEEILGFSNKWYAMALERTEQRVLANGIAITIPQAAIFLATKLAAFHGRGHDDLLGSHDLEDIITLVAGRPELVSEIADESEPVRGWVAARVKGLLDHPDFPYALQGALPDAAELPEYRKGVRGRFEAIAALT